MQIIHETSRTLTVTSPLYDLGGGAIRSFVVKNGAATLTIVSPPMNFTESEFAQMEGIGKVGSLVASNKFHYLGIAAWKKRFPNAKIYTSQTALPRLKVKIGPEVNTIEPLNTEPDLHFLSCPETRNGELLVVCKEESGWIWYITDLFFNFVDLPTTLFSRLMVQKICGLGVVVNPFCRFLFIKDRQQVRTWLNDNLHRYPPKSIIFSHGDPIHTPELIAAFKNRVQEY